MFQPDWSGGHAAAATQSSATWYFAEGSAQTIDPRAFTTYLLLANPGAAAADVEVQFLRTNGTPVTTSLTVAPLARVTLWANAQVPALADESFGTVVRTLNGTQIVVERSIYWRADGEPIGGGTSAAAVPLP